MKSGAAASITDAQFKTARRYGFSSWPTLKAHVDALTAMAEFEQAAEAQDVERNSLPRYAARNFSIENTVLRDSR